MVDWTFGRLDVWTFFASLLILAQTLIADTITFTGTGIAMQGCTIQGVQGGQVSYTDARGQRQRRPLEQIEALGFDGLPQLDQAEGALAGGDLDAGEWALLRALLAAENDVQRTWIHARLSAVHDQRGEYVQAAGHAAEVFALSDDVSWKSLRPVSPVNTPTYAAASEALESLQTAAKRVKTAELQREIETMTRLVQGVQSRLAAEYKGPPIARGSTASGFPRDLVLANERRPAADALAAASSAATASPSSTPAAKPEPTPAPPVVQTPSDPRSAAAIDQLLDARRGTDALALCVEIARDPGERDLAHFLFQYGRALALEGQNADAAIMFTRSAVLYPDSPDSAPALIETAMIYRDEFKNVETARRLLQLAIAHAERDDQSSVVMLAREVLATLDKP